MQGNGHTGNGQNTTPSKTLSAYHCQQLTLIVRRQEALARHGGTKVQVVIVHQHVCFRFENGCFIMQNSV